MSDPIVILADYKSHFGSKYVAEPYRSGMDLNRLIPYFEEAGYQPEVTGLPDVDFRDRDWRGTPVLYTSSEDGGGRYKSYIEDVVLGLELAGARVLPRFPLLRAHNNKVFMEILRDLAVADTDPGSLRDGFEGIRSSRFGTLEEWEARQRKDGIDPARPTVVKPAAGALSRGVGMAGDAKDLRSKIAAISRSHDIRQDLWDAGRAVRRKGYVRESRNREKFITQNFVPGLDHDWKVLVFGDRYYAIRREARVGDFRASGGGRISYSRDLPPGLLPFAESVFLALDVPHVSLDIGVTEEGFLLFEFQALYFGTLTLDQSEFHFVRSGKGWELTEGASELERVYAQSVVRFLGTATR